MHPSALLFRRKGNPSRQLRRRRRARTSILISHRLSTVRDADRLVVLADGTVAEQGTHDELIDAGGVYAELFELQAAGYRAPGLRTRDADIVEVQ